MTVVLHPTAAVLLQAAMEAEIRSTLTEKGRSTSGYSGFERSLARLQGESAWLALGSGRYPAVLPAAAMNHCC